jgi:adenosylhomocysteine nucleosidase
MKCHKSVLAIFALVIFSLASSVFADDIRVGILGAFPEELKNIKSVLTDKKSEKVLGIEFTTGILKGKKVVIAETGIAKVNAAMTTTLLLEKFHPSKVIFTGIAGGLNPDLQPGDIVIAEKLAQHDLGKITPEGFKPCGERNPIDGKRNPIFFPCDKSLVALAKKVSSTLKLESFGDSRHAKIIVGVIVTGDLFVASEKKRLSLRKEFGADATEMEGAAVGQICYQNKVPFLVIRSLSDNADNKARADINKFYRIAAKNSASLVIKIIQDLN